MSRRGFVWFPSPNRQPLGGDTHRCEDDKFFSFPRAKIRKVFLYVTASYINLPHSIDWGVLFRS